LVSAPLKNRLQRLLADLRVQFLQIGRCRLGLARASIKGLCRRRYQLALPVRDLVRMHLVLLGQLNQRHVLA